MAATKLNLGGWPIHLISRRAGSPEAGCGDAVYL